MDVYFFHRLVGAKVGVRRLPDLKWATVKITYGITLDEFRTLQLPLSRRRHAKTAYWVIMLAICLALIVPGLGLLIQQWNQGQGFSAAALGSIGVGALLCFCIYFVDRRSARRKLAQREEELLAAYERIHCRNARVLEADAESLSFSCECGLVVRQWSELTGFTETPSFLIPLTRTDSFAIPKSAFASEGELTEFRRLVLEKLHTDRPFNACPIEFAHTRADFWRAKLLHMRKGGGWRRVLKLGLATAALVYVVGASVVAARAGQAPAWLVPVALGALAFFLTKIMRPQRRYYGPLRIYFSEEGFHVVDPLSQSRRRWNEMAGYLESRHLYLLYLNPRLYRIVPKRALGNRSAEFERLLHAALPAFDYRRHCRVADTARV